MCKQYPILGCIADDFTGATDLASFLVKSGLRTLQINNLPTPDMLDSLQGFDAVVVALKIRTVEKQQAVQQTLSALNWLQQAHCQRFFYKYCSTFDSTPKGNIGPVIDALLDKLKQNSTLVCPALPVNGRTVYNGYLFVNGQPLNESPLKDHPLTPMTDPSIIRMLEKQGHGKAINIPYETVEQGETVLRAAIQSAKQQYNYLVVDAISQQHLLNIGAICDEFSLITGGSGIALDLKPALGIKQKNHLEHEQQFSQAAPTIVLSGSCSAMTQSQVAEYLAHNPGYQIQPLKIQSGEQSLESITNWLHTLPSSAKPIIYATATPEQVKENQTQLGVQTAQELVEGLFAQLAKHLYSKGYRNFVVAGGETSGAVVSALAINRFEIGPSIAPGVPLVRTLDDNPVNLALKSGNFGDKHFFQTALGQMTC
ncbi:hypothetical protein C2869_05140 [Saccharobesus litoralis]|uniref:3-oxo-tetronate kinase n=1 Tax=Saccharobesus litoralis TaxID=2172099 RepID=A0A2S0VNV2_9ALTE|nr:3-oxo-tetronate kinase [Saccharobesus litoralis]AWB65862.1 hypothetical protein C2869_05140 [Saccharobesus litoralis]